MWPLIVYTCVCTCVYACVTTVLKVNATEMEKNQQLTDAWKLTAQDVIDMLVSARDPDNLKPGNRNNVNYIRQVNAVNGGDIVMLDSVLL